MRALALVAASTVWTFEKDKVNEEPGGFEFATTKGGPPGKWRVIKDGDSNVLAQLDEDKNEDRFALAVAKEHKFKNLSLTVKLKPVKGEKDQTGGLVWRYQDSDNYYLVRVSVKENDLNLYKVHKGNRTRLKRKGDARIEAGKWYTLGIQHTDSTIRVYLNRRKFFESEDETFEDKGQIGVWTKADSVTYFDRLKVEGMD